MTVTCEGGVFGIVRRWELIRETPSEKFFS